MGVVMGVIEGFVSFLMTIEVTDILDMAIIAFLVYRLLSLLRNTGSVRVLKGVLIVLAALWLSTMLRLQALSYLLNYVVELGLTALIIIFQPEIRRMLEQVKTEVRLADTNLVFDIIVTLRKGDSYAKTRIANYHTNVVTIEKNGEKLKDEPVEDESEKGLTDRSFLSVKTIYDFANSVEIDDVREVLDRQIQYNTAIAEEGLRGDYGANVGSILLHSGPDTVKNRAKAYAAAGSDARMNGCELPVVINAGSGNQGITVTMPLVVYAKELGASQEQLYRALTLANLIGIHQKTGIGRLSAFCGAISAGAAAGCGVAYLKGGDLKAISHTLVNALAVVSGVICDGAKASCAGKIAVGVDAGIMGYEMYCYNQQFRSGDGIVKKGVENTIANVGRLGREGMRETDQEILKIMIEDWTNP